MTVFFFTDIEGSTRLWEEHSRAMGAVIDRHNAILQRQIEAHGGRIFKQTGDGVAAAFDVGEPVACALETQVRMAAEPWGEVGELRIRMGLHAGQAELHAGDYFGLPVNCTARVMSAAWGGQALLTPEVTRISGLPAQASVLDLGEHLLRNVTAPQRILQLLHPELPWRAFPPPRTVSGESIRRAVAEEGVAIAGLAPPSMVVALVSAILVPILQGDLSPHSPALAGDLGLLDDLGAVALGGFVAQFAARLQAGQAAGQAWAMSEVRARLEGELLERWEGSDETALALRGDASRLLQVVHGVQAAMAAARDDVKAALARGLADLGSQFGEFRWMLAGVQDTLAEMRARQEQHLALTEEILQLQREKARAAAGPALPAPAAPPAFLEGDEGPFERPVFVAREGELARLDGWLDLALAGQGQVAFVTGDAGSGKTALIQEFAHRAQETQPDLVFAAGHGNAQTGLGDPYLPFREILGLLTGDVEAQWAAGAMTTGQARRLWDTLPSAAQALVEVGPDLIDTFVLRAALLKRAVTHEPGGAEWLARLAEREGGKPVSGPGVAAAQQSDLFEQYSRVLQALARRGPLLLVVDDLQWADLGSISLLFHLGRQLARSRILIVGSYRPEEVALGREGARHPLEPVVHEFQRDFGDIIVNLGQAEGRDLTEALLDSEPNQLPGSFREMLYQQTRGHPLFTVELLRGMQARGDLIEDREGRWVEGPALDWQTLPARVEAVVAERISRLAEPSRAALQVASVEGETFTAEVVARVQAADEREVVGRLSRELDWRHRLVRAEGIQRLDGQRLSHYRFRHILFQKYLYSSLDEVERAYLHEQVGTVLEGLYGGANQDMSSAAPQLAWHFQEAGMAAKAIPYLRQAGERALRLSAYQEAVVHLTRGLELLRALPAYGGEGRRLERAEQELALQLGLGIAWVGVRGYASEAKQAFTRARELSQQVGDTSQLCRAVGELSIYHYVWAEYPRARELAEEALSLAQQAGDPLLVALEHACLGFILFSVGEYTTARAHLAQMIAFYDPEQHHRPFLSLRGSDLGVSALAYDACCLWCLGYPEQAWRRSREALALARELGHALSLIDVLSYAGCLFDGMRRDARGFHDQADEMKRLAREKKLPGWLGLASRHYGQALTLLGHLEDGIAHIRDALALQQSDFDRCYRSGCLCSLALAEGKAGRPEEGLRTLAEALALVEQTGERYTEAELYRVQAELLLLLGDEAGAEASLQQAVEVARRQSARAWELRAATSLARLWQQHGRAQEARRMLAEIYGWFTEGFDTPDLSEASALLADLAGPTAA